jgi:two-component system response regulator VicR
MEQRAPKILVVDDEAALADVLKVYLKNEGYEVLVAGDGRTAVTLALREQPDLVLLDLNLPKLPGLDAFREIRARSP